METRWQFDQDEESRWRWTRMNGDKPEAQSAESFERPRDCVLDAMRHVVRRHRPSSAQPE
jgi:hypothetical protein